MKRESKRKYFESESSSDSAGGTESSDDSSGEERGAPKGKGRAYRENLPGMPSVSFPKYDGRMPISKWAQKAIRIIKAYHISNEVALSLIEDSLEGTAAQVFEQRPREIKRGPPKAVFDYLVEKCSRRKPIWAAPMSLFSLTQGKRESVLDFSLRLQTEARNVGWIKNDPMLLSIFMKGVHDGIASDLVRANPTYFEDAVEIAQTIETLVDVAGRVRGTRDHVSGRTAQAEQQDENKSVRFMNKSTQMLKDQINEVANSLADLRREMRSGLRRSQDRPERTGYMTQQRVNQPVKTQDDFRSRPNGCWNCGKSGHMARDCPEKQYQANNWQSGSKESVCWHCGRQGHYRSECSS